MFCGVGRALGPKGLQQNKPAGAGATVRPLGDIGKTAPLQDSEILLRFKLSANYPSFYLPAKGNLNRNQLWVSSSLRMKSDSLVQKTDACRGFK